MEPSLATRGAGMRRKLSDNVAGVQENIAESANKAARQPSAVTLVAVTKAVDLDVIRGLLELGQVDLGESRAQQLVQRAGMLQEQLSRRAMLDGEQRNVQPRWHMVGHVQRNKVKALLPAASMIHSVDTLRLAEEINGQAAKEGLTADVLIQVNSSGETQKHGMPVAAAGHFIEQALQLSHLRICGMMTMAPQVTDSEKSRPVFERLYELFLEVKMAYRLGKEFEHLSMGTSQDYAVAVQCGATIVRVGSVLFEGIGDSTA